MTQRLVARAAALRGTIHVPSDKSIGHRALLANAIAEGEAEVRLRAPGADLESTIGCLVALGGRIRRRGAAIEVRGARLEPPRAALDCGNSGTTMRLLAGLLAGQPVDAVLDGDDSLSSRPMERVAAPLRAMGARVSTTDGHAPIEIRGGALRATDHELPVASAQVLGAIAFAALGGEGDTTVRLPGPTRDHTERLLAWMGVRIRRKGTVTTISGPARPAARSLDVPGDPSSAAAWLVAAALHRDADLLLPGVCLNPTRLAILDVLREMGATVDVEERAADGPEPVGDLRVRSGDRLRPISVGGPDVAALIDELPLLGVAMAAADGVSELRDAGELRVKESDRIAAMVAGLHAIGADVEELPDGWRVRPGLSQDAEITTRGDHRIGIAFAVAALTGVAGTVRIDDAESASVSYPGFWADLDAIAAVPA
ncbi:MAG: 3-phosphoshikimate 1-carboxyvinyltransferase [Chloroflexota bacterium]|nr:3-phosphoshikimate 1-carboxyvinyltransferase [Chloroflexota bacterium]